MRQYRHYKVCVSLVTGSNARSGGIWDNAGRPAQCHLSGLAGRVRGSVPDGCAGSLTGAVFIFGLITVGIAMTLKHQLNILGSVAASTLAGWRGGAAGKPHFRQPAQRPVLYDIEASPYCRLVREAASALHLDLDIRPCPKGGTRFRPEAERLGGKLQFPLLSDPNTGTVLHESADIVEYLFRTYAGRATPSAYRAGRLRKAGGYLATISRGLRGLKATPAKVPAQPLRLWSFEASPYSRPVRERLCELELPYALHNLGKEHWTEIGPAVQRLKPGPYRPIAGGKREAFMQVHGRVQVPYLEDPNTGAALFESADILDYLERTYAR